MRRVTGPQHGAKITYVQPGSERLWHATVTSRKEDKFFFAPSWSTHERLIATDAQEDCVWTRGYLRWWWPSHRRRRKALLAAYALGEEKVHIAGSDMSFEETLAAAQRALDRGMRKLNADRVKLTADAARLVRGVGAYPWRFRR